MFTLIESAQIMLRCNGFFKEGKLYHYKNEVYTKIGTGYLKIYNAGLTTKSNYTWVDIEGIELVYDKCVLQYREVEREYTKSE